MMDVRTLSDKRRCLFRSLLIALNQKLQTVERADDSTLTNRLRAKVIGFESENHDCYKELDVITNNADL